MTEVTGLIRRFYEAFQQRDYAVMIDCYHPEVHFRDEVFDLRGKAAGAMWHMLCERGEDLRIDFSDVQAEGESGSASWTATYTFGATGRRVENRIQARFRFRDGKIIAHHDSFSFRRWSRMALGLPGLLLGWSPFLRRKVSRTAGRALEKFIEQHPEYRSV